MGRKGIVQGGVALIASTASVQGKGQSKSSASLAIKALRTHLGIPTLSHRCRPVARKVQSVLTTTRITSCWLPLSRALPPVSFLVFPCVTPSSKFGREATEGAQRFFQLFINEGCELPEPWPQDRKITQLQHIPLHRHTVRRCTASHGTATSLKAYAIGGCPLDPAQRGHSGMAQMPQKE